MNILCTQLCRGVNVDGICKSENPPHCVLSCSVHLHCSPDNLTEYLSQYLRVFCVSLNECSVIIFHKSIFSVYAKYLKQQADTTDWNYVCCSKGNLQAQANILNTLKISLKNVNILFLQIFLSFLYKESTSEKIRFLSFCHLNSPLLYQFKVAHITTSKQFHIQGTTIWKKIQDWHNYLTFT